MGLTEQLLSVRDIGVAYGSLRALFGVSLDVQRGSIVTLLGANGAGKTTTLKAISGLLKLTSGEIRYRNEVISKCQPHEIVAKRICHVPEGRGVFPNLTVEENLDLGAWAAPVKDQYDRDLEKGFTLFPRLKERRKQLAGTLSGGEQQMLAIARALMGQPELLLLDEPSLGLAPKIIEKIYETISEINAAGVTILLVEQNAHVALQVAHFGLVIETGRIVAKGTAKELLDSADIRKAYLGE